MCRHYSTRDFFRQMPNRLLGRYFEAHGALTELDFAAMKETKPDALFAAWLELPEDRRNEMDAELLEIDVYKRQTLLCGEKRTVGPIGSRICVLRAARDFPSRRFFL